MSSTDGIWWRDLDPWGYLDDTYLDSPEAWDALAAVVRAAGVCGLDSEFYGLDVRKESCVGRARIHVWSLAVRTKKRSPLGFHCAVGWVLPVAALEHPGLRAVLEDPSIEKDIHNQPVDDHSANNHGVKLVGAVDTLNLSRWVWPWLTTAGGFGLKNLMQVKLRREPVCEYKDVVNDVRQIEVRKIKSVKKTACSCGVLGCRLRKGHEKSKVTVEVEEVKLKDEKFQHPLESIVEGHPRRELLIRYAAEDAVAAVEVKELADKEKDPAPFPYTWTSTHEHPTQDGVTIKVTHGRPKFNQAVCNAIVLMEREGLPVDTRYAGEMVTRAEGDERKELAWLRTWYRANMTEADGEWFEYTDEDIDGIWSSPKQTGELFDYFDFPRSPIWKRGKVKPGEMKLDSTALKWIARNHADAKPMIDRILQLKKVRAGKKYMVKLRDCGGWINIICGPAGDADDRNGAVTGRLGVKGTLEAQQLPTKEEVDLYHVRKAIVARDMREADNLRVA